MARIPPSIAGPSRLPTNLEVATMTYCKAKPHTSVLGDVAGCLCLIVQSKISLPILKIPDWRDDPSNPTRTEYIIQDHVAGVQLHLEWPKMTPEQPMLCTKVLSLTMKKMLL
jgi:hypothetical protein